MEALWTALLSDDPDELQGALDSLAADDERLIMWMFVGWKAMVLCELSAARVTAAAGTKAVRLAQAARAGWRVPEGFVVEPHAVERLAASDAGLAVEVEARFARLSAPTAAVRSSSPTEDGSAATLAGEFLTRLRVRGFELVDAIVEVGYSGPDRHGTAIPVLVQSMVTGPVGGVATSCHPVTGDGGAVVEHSRQGPQTVTAGTGPVSTATARRGRDGSFAAEDGREPFVDLTLGALEGLRRLFDTEVNIEWIIDSAGRFVLLQVRPLTAPASRRRPPPAAERLGDPTRLSGVALSAGRAAGPAFKVDTATDPARSQPVPEGAVAVAHSLRLDQLELLGAAAGLVVTDPSVLSHVAIRARELALPAVGGIASVVTELAEGAVVEVDGTAGIISVESGTAVTDAAPPWNYFDPWALTGIERAQARFVIDTASADGDPVWVFAHRPLDPAHRSRVRDVLQELGVTRGPVVFDERTAWLPGDNSPSIVFDQYATWQHVRSLPRLRRDLDAAIDACDRLNADELTQTAVSVTAAAQRSFQSCIAAVEAVQAGAVVEAERAAALMGETRLLHGALLGVVILDVLAARAIDRAGAGHADPAGFIDAVGKIKNRDLAGFDNRGNPIGEYEVIDRFYRSPVLETAAAGYQW